MVQPLSLNNTANIKSSDSSAKSTESSAEISMQDTENSFSKVLEENTETDSNIKKESNIGDGSNVEEVSQNQEASAPESIEVYSEELIEDPELMVEMDDNLALAEPDLVPESSIEEGSILSSIQAAQQVNTSINSTSVSLASDDLGTQQNTVDGVIKNDMSKTSLKTMLTEDNVDNKAATNLELSPKVSPKTSTEIVATATQEASIEGSDVEAEFLFSNESKEGVKQEKTETLTTMLKTEGVAATQSVIDANGAKPIQTNAAQTDKLVAVNQQAQATNNLLDEPLDLQSKQAASMVGERVMMMISQGKQEVQIRLDPAELGSMFVKVNVSQDQIQLNIQTQVGLSKEIIEQNMPRLREQLSQQGIQLGEANVEQQSQQQSQHQKQSSSIASSSATGNNVNTVEDGQTATWIASKIPSRAQGIDYYA